MQRNWHVLKVVQFSEKLITVMSTIWRQRFRTKVSLLYTHTSYETVNQISEVGSINKKN